MRVTEEAGAPGSRRFLALTWDHCIPPAPRCKLRFCRPGYNGSSRGQIAEVNHTYALRAVSFEQARSLVARSYQFYRRLLLRRRGTALLAHLGEEDFHWHLRFLPEELDQGIDRHL
jgi:hypothetical protein